MAFWKNFINSAFSNCMTELKFQDTSGLLKGLSAVSHFTCSAGDL